jgi:multicomponent K+:H+ antiporter subunit E
MTLFRGLIPAPLASSALLVLWLVLTRSNTRGQVVLGLAVALLVPILASGVRLTQVRVGRPWAVVRYVVRVCRDVVASNVAVALGVIAWRRRRPEPRFVVVPLELRDPVALAVLCMVTTIVPGTVWAELALDRTTLMLHVWDAPDEAAFISFYKSRYERPLLEIFR